MTGEVTLITTSEKVILQSSSETPSCVHWMGCPQNTAKTMMDDGDGSLHSIMEALDSVYSGSMMYTALINKLNTIQQGNGEAAKDYYKCMVQIRVKLQEFHLYMF